MQFCVLSQLVQSICSGIARAHTHTQIICIIIVQFTRIVWRSNFSHLWSSEWWCVLVSELSLSFMLYGHSRFPLSRHSDDFKHIITLSSAFAQLSYASSRLRGLAKMQSNYLASNLLMESVNGRINQSDRSASRASERATDNNGEKKIMYENLVLIFQFFFFLLLVRLVNCAHGQNAISTWTHLIWLNYLLLLKFSTAVSYTVCICNFNAYTYKNRRSCAAHVCQTCKRWTIEIKPTWVEIQNERFIFSYVTLERIDEHAGMLLLLIVIICDKTSRIEFLWIFNAL